MDFCRQQVKRSIEYDVLVQQYDPERLNELVELLVEVICSQQQSFSIAGGVYPATFVKERMQSLNFMHIQYVMDCLAENTSKIIKIKAYLLATLFNAATTIDNYYSSRCNHDFGSLVGASQ